METDPREVLALLELGRDRVARAWTRDPLEIDLALQQTNKPDAGPCKVCVLMALWLDPDTSTGPGFLEELEEQRARVDAQQRLDRVLWPGSEWDGTGRLQDWNDRQVTVAPVLAVYDQAVAELRAELAP